MAARSPFQVVRNGPIAIIEPSGRLDERASREFERLAAGIFGERVRAVVVDLAKVDMITSAGIRVLLLIRQRLERTGGGLALCALNHRVRGVLDISRLLPQFRITATRPEALAELAAFAHAPAAAAPPSSSKLTVLVSQALAGDGPEPERSTGATRSKLASLVLKSLT